MPDSIFKHLPSTAQAIAGLIGLPKAARLVEAFGGTTFPVPVGEKRKIGLMRRAALAEVIGEEEAHKIIQHFGGQELYIPRCAKALRVSRDTALIKDFDQLCKDGYSANEACNDLALKYRLSNRRIYDILKQPLPETPQRRLF
jgi:Mor family transcriptional regulator